MMCRSIWGMEGGNSVEKGEENTVCDAHLVTRQVSRAEVSLAPPQRIYDTRDLKDSFLLALIASH